MPLSTPQSGAQKSLLRICVLILAIPIVCAQYLTKIPGDMDPVHRQQAAAYRLNSLPFAHQLLALPTDGIAFVISICISHH